MLYACGDVLPDRLVERLPFLARERVCFSAGMQPRVEEDLVRVNVAYAGDHLLIQDQRLYLGSPGTEGLTQIFYTEPFIERLRTQRREPRLQLICIQQPRPTKARLVSQEQPLVSLQIENEHQRGSRLL